ncbi:hypothetical protein AMS68_000310 [Peltaster fructicola]|uniref:RRM domain-containing protein n=1 Tax=Peltaster fructicola TaxID=286661 RepID=A0A6H0XJ87_9PEZI|nr:hypothetical protein AMS68_000310 [Peltaster fructicola]
MPQQIKSEINRSGYETTDMPSVCERCLPESPYVQMLKEDRGMTCKLCSRPATLFTWKADRTTRQKKTGICLTCARLKNCCQCCLLDLSFGLPITIRDAALKMITPGPQSEINREYYAQNHEKDIEEGRGLEGYEKTDEKARELLRRLANTEPYHKKQRRLEAEEDGPKLLEGGTGPVRTSDVKKSAYGSHTSRTGTAPRNGKGPAKGRPFPGAGALPPRAEDIQPPADKNVVSLFVTGVEDDLPEHEIRTYFQQYGALRSVVCSHRSHCAFINYMERSAAEVAASACQGRAVVKGVPLRVQWGRPKPLDSLDQETRMEHARAGRQVAAAPSGSSQTRAIANVAAPSSANDLDGLAAVAAPPGQDDVQYAAMAGE